MQSNSISAKRFAIVIAMVMLMVTAIGSMNVSYAAMSSVPSPVQTESIKSSSSYTGEYYKVTTPSDEKSTIYVEGKTKIKTKRFCIRVKNPKVSTYAITVFVTPNNKGEFSVKINTAKGNTDTPEIIGGKGTVAKSRESYDTCPGYKPVGDMGPGTYHLTIARATTAKGASLAGGWYKGELGGMNGDTYAYKEVVMTINKGQNNNPKVVKYDSVIKNNKAVSNAYEKNSTTIPAYKGSYVRYQDTYMKDMSFVFKNPKTGKMESMTASKVKYIKNTSNSVVKGAKTKYDKALKIYEYVGSNFYYDTLAYQTGKNQFANPYNNLYNLRNKKSADNSKGGKVATTCQGYASMVIALARAQGIPARLAEGRHISQPITIWSDMTKSQMGKSDHWWAELWIDGRWVVVDANAATASKEERTSFSGKVNWKKADYINYAHFDPTPEQMSNSYAYIGIYPGATDGKYANNKKEVNQLRAFLNTKSSGKTNGKRLNSKYASGNIATWTTGKTDNFKTDGFGRVTHISWGKKNLAGSMNLSNFSKLAYLTVYSNKLTKLNLTNCSNLQYISASYNKLTSFNSIACKATEINTQGNNLNTAKFKNGSKTVTIQGTGGSFSFKYKKSNSKSLTIYVEDAKKGYKYKGIYTGSGKKVSSSKTYTFKPTATKYIVKYTK